MPDTSEAADPSEESAVLNLDSATTLSGIQLALEAFARTIPGAAVFKITFEQQPDVKDGGIWRARATLQCLGALQRKTTPDYDSLVNEPSDFLSNVEPQVISQQSWTAEGTGFAGAVEELRDVVESHLENLIIQRQSDLQAATEALRVLRNPTELNNVWSLTDNPQDEPLDEHPVESAQ